MSSTDDTKMADASNPIDAPTGKRAASVELDSTNGAAPEVKKAKVQEPSTGNSVTEAATVDQPNRIKGTAPIKAEFLISMATKEVPDDDAAEAGLNDSANVKVDDRDRPGRQKKDRGQNKGRKFQFQRDAIILCSSLPGLKDTKPGTAEGKCTYSGVCKGEHDLKKYLADGKLPELEGICPVFALTGTCGGKFGGSGWKCRWLSSHKKEIGGGDFELVEDLERLASYQAEIKELQSKRRKVTDIREGGDRNANGEDTMEGEVINTVDMKYKIMLRSKKYQTKKSEVYLDWMEKSKGPKGGNTDDHESYVDAPLNSAEKRHLYISPETPILAPLTTTGNLPFRRLCVEMGAAVTYSEMAMSLPLLQGHKPEWTLLRAHETETPSFGVQLCATKPWQAVKATEAITTLLPGRGLSFVDLNCGCPIDLVYKAGGGSALLEQQSKLVKMLKGMNYVSGETPITVKIRMGCRTDHPTAQKLVGKLISEGDVATITLHGRSRQQRYKNEADWKYISETATLIKNLKAEMDARTDTAEFKEQRDKTVSGRSADEYGVKFIGNGDCFSGPQYYENIRNTGVDSIMIARGALIKPWIFEEIQAGQYLDKTSSERLLLVERYAKLGLSHWGSDEYGIGMTRRFLLEWLSFTHRYIPVGLLEYLPPSMNDRPPLFRGRNEMETLMASGDYRDWVKISEMFLGKTPESFQFVPKHKSNAYDAGMDAEAEG